jgi:Ca2+-binding EF-hand superfamily protein
MGDQLIEVTIPDIDPKMADAFTQAFRRFDTNRSGTLDKHEFREFLKFSGRTDLNTYLFEIIDSDHSGSVSLDEFITWGQAVRDVAQAKDVRRWLKMVFDSCSQTHPGSLTRKEFFKFMKYCGVPVAFFQKTKVYTVFDVNANGTIEFNEIMEHIHFSIGGHTLA